jgi:predicted ester cyclase
MEEDTETKKALVRRVIEEVYNRNSLEAVDETYAADYVFHPAFGPEVHGLEGVKDLVNRRREVFPEVTLTIEDQIAEADKVVTRWTVRDAYQRETAGSLPNSDQSMASGIIIDRIEDHRIKESWGEESSHLRGVTLFN